MIVGYAINQTRKREVKFKFHRECETIDNRITKWFQRETVDTMDIQVYTTLQVSFDSNVSFIEEWYQEYYAKAEHLLHQILKILNIALN